MRKVLTRADIAQHVSALQQQDVIWSPLYDFQDYGTAGSTQYTFFTAPIGSGTTSAPGAAGNKTIADTNMRAAGQLTKGNAFFCTGVETILYPGGATTFGPGESTTVANTGRFVNDLYRVGKGGVLTLTVGSDRKYVEDGPLAVFPPTSRLAVAAALSNSFDSDTTDTAVLTQVNYAALGGEPYSIVPVYLDANQGFQVAVNFPVAIAPASATTLRFGVRLRGYLIRNAQ